MKTALALRHVPFEDLGSLEPLLADRGFGITYLDLPGLDPDGADLETPDLLVVLGGPIGVYETEDYPFLAGEIDGIARRIAQDLPTLGICLGCQLIARALDARVYPSGHKEIGWAPLELTEAGRGSCLGALRDSPVLHWHGDTFDLPAGAELLASTSICAQQAYSVGRKVLGLQFHIEVTATGLESWLVGHTAEIAATPNLTVTGLRSDTQTHGNRLESVAREVLGAWLDGAGL